MKKPFLALLLFLILLIPGNSWADSWLIRSGKGIGSIELGDPIEKFESCLGKTTVRMGALYWYVDEGLEFYAPSNQIDRIIIVKPSYGLIDYRDSSGITVGSNAEDVQREFGHAERSLFSREIYLLDYVDRGITFFIRNGEVCKILLYRSFRNCSLTP